VIGLSSALSVNEISSTVQGRILNCLSCRKKKKSTHFRRSQMLWPVWIQACHTLKILS